MLETIDQRPRATVLDLGGFQTPQERLIATVAALDHLWDRRGSREPRLIVLDEAHNICPAEPDGPLQALATERLIQIAGEGRKYGLWLIVATQRPAKVHPNVISQCDNLVVLRMNSPGDLREIGRLFGFAPPAMLEGALSFRKGEVLGCRTIQSACPGPRADRRSPHGGRRGGHRGSDGLGRPGRTQPPVVDHRRVQ